MPLSGEYSPSPVDYAREQAEAYMVSNGAEGTELDGKPVILLTTVGAKSGKLHKTPLMRVERDGRYAIVASATAAAVAEGEVQTSARSETMKPPHWYYNIKKNPRVELQDGPTVGDYDAREVFLDEKAPPESELMHDALVRSSGAAVGAQGGRTPQPIPKNSDPHQQIRPEPGAPGRSRRKVQTEC